jgi:RNA-directed DNA polymerase
MLIWSAPLRYKVYYIAKRQPGRFRQIAQPTPEVKLLQRWLIENYFNKFPVHKSAKAYRIGVGLSDNVKPHADNRFLLKIDFKNFFPSIKDEHFVSFMREHGETPEDIDVVRNICFRRERGEGSLQLAIGAPSSPLLSNILLHSFDSQIDLFAKANAVTYTRYADDLSFSCNHHGILSKMLLEIPGMIKNNCLVPLEINEEKTVHASKKNGRRVTGLNITPDGKISVGQERKRLLRAQIHRYKNGNLPQDEIEGIRGYLAFLNSVEPEHLTRLVRKYGRDTMSELFSGEIKQT